MVGAGARPPFTRRSVQPRTTRTFIFTYRRTQLLQPKLGLPKHALRAGFTIEEIFNLTKIDRWFLVQIKEIVDFEEELATAKN